MAADLVGLAGDDRRFLSALTPLQRFLLAINRAAAGLRLCCSYEGLVIIYGLSLRLMAAEAGGAIMSSAARGGPIIPAQATAAGLATALTVGATAGVIPAIHAARLSPTQTLRS